MRAGLAVFGISVAMLAAAAVAQSPTTPPAAAPSMQADVIAGRQAAFLMSAANFGGMKGAIDRGDDVKTQAFAARGLARWAKALPGMFPAGSMAPTSEASAKIWSDRAGFEKAAGNYAAAADSLAALAAANDKPGFAAQWSVVKATCSACHDAYRDEKKRPG